MVYHLGDNNSGAFQANVVYQMISPMHLTLLIHRVILPYGSYIQSEVCHAAWGLLCRHVRLLFTTAWLELIETVSQIDSWLHLGRIIGLVPLT